MRRSKSVFDFTLSPRQSCYCAFCKTQRKVYTSKNLSLLAVLGLVSFSFLITYLIWKNLDPRGLFILALMLLTGELFSQLKWRQSMICSNCGFDAVLYLKNPDRAALKIKDFMEYRATRPEFLLKPPLPVRIATRTEPNSAATRSSSPSMSNVKTSSRGKNISLRG